MPLEEKKRQLSQSSAFQTGKSSEKKEIDKSIFEGRPYLSFDEAQRKLGSLSPFVPGFPNAITKQEIQEITNSLKQKYGPYLKKQDCYRILKDLELEISKVQGPEKYKKIKEYRFIQRGLLGQ